MVCKEEITNLLRTKTSVIFPHEEKRLVKSLLTTSTWSEGSYPVTEMPRLL